ncbi:MAG: response regulator [Candidatus Xenobiia bacterium LiM19]
MKGTPVVILLVEDDPAHAEIVRRNFLDFRIANRLIHLTDGQEALDYLDHQGNYRDSESSPRPNIVLLDLRLPKRDGMEVLKSIKSNPELSNIPVVILTTSRAEADMVKAYQCHANSYLVKPVDFQKFVELMDTLGYYWLAWNAYPYETK